MAQADNRTVQQIAPCPELGVDAPPASARRPLTSRIPAASLAAATTLLGLLLAAVPSTAQYTRTEAPQNRFRLGPLRFTPRLELRNAGRDTNVFLDPTNPLADTSVVVRASAEGYVPVRSRLRLFGEGWLDWSYFEAYSAERSTDPGGEGRAELDLGPITLVGGGGGFQSRQLYTIDIDQRILHEERYGFGGAEWRVTRLLSISGGAEKRTYRYDRSFRTSTFGPTTAAALERDNLTGQADVRYKITPLTTVVVTGQVLEDTFALSAPGLRTTRSYRYMGGFEFGEKAFLTGRILAGMRNFPASSSGSLPAYRGPAVQGELTLPLFTRGRIVGTALRDVFVAQAPVATVEQRGRNTYILTSLQGTLDWSLPLRLLGRLSAGYQKARYILTQTVDGVPFPREDHLYSAGASLLRRFGDSLRIGGTVTYYRRVSTIPGNSYDRWIYGVSAEVRP